MITMMINYQKLKLNFVNRPKILKPLKVVQIQIKKCIYQVKII